MWVNIVLILLCWTTLGLVFGIAFGRMVALADKADEDLANELNRPAGPLQESDISYKTPRRAA